MASEREAAEWMAQWRSARRALAELRRQRLQSMTDSQALAESETLLSLLHLTQLSEERRCTSGLVQQQSLFHRRTIR